VISWKRRIPISQSDSKVSANAGPGAKIECHIKVGGATTVVADRLAEETGLSRQRVKQAMQKGAVWLTRGKQTTRLRRASKLLKLDDEVHVYYDHEILSTVPTPCELIADEDAYSVWYKPYGVWSQGSKWGDHCTIHRWAEQHLKPQRAAFIVHRLDRAATGLMLLAHQKRVATKLAKLFEERSIEKRYRAIVHGAYPIGRPARTIDNEIDGRHAISHVEGIEYDSKQDRSIADVVIVTGRKHQIRRHLSEIGFPVVGDRMYGRDGDKEDLQLAAIRLAFTCPISGEGKLYELRRELTPRLSRQSHG
jgi:tRNA pseudouridine32 synthase/23S rRNA pseudouridine746 synthase